MFARIYKTLKVSQNNEKTENSFNNLVLFVRVLLSLFLIRSEIKYHCLSDKQTLISIAWEKSHKIRITLKFCGFSIMQTTFQKLKYDFWS